MNQMCGNNWEYIEETPSKEYYVSESVNTSTLNDSRVIEESQNRGGLKPQQTNQPTIGEAVRALFDFMDKEIDVKNYAKKATLRQLQNKVEAIVYQEKKHATTQCELRKVGRKSIRRIAQPQVVDSDSDSEDGVSAFDMFRNTPAFKQANQQMMVTRSQKKSTKKRMRKSMPAPEIIKEVQQETGSDAEVTEFGQNKRELRSMKKRRLN